MPVSIRTCACAGLLVFESVERSLHLEGGFAKVSVSNVDCGFVQKVAFGVISADGTVVEFTCDIAAIGSAEVEKELAFFRFTAVFLGIQFVEKGSQIDADFERSIVFGAS